MDFSTNFVAIVGAVTLFLLYNLWRVNIKLNAKSLPPTPPEVPGALPIIGHLHRILEKRPLARILGSFADKCGPIFMFRLGMHPTVVISNNKVMKEFYTTNDKFCASRPRSTIASIVSFNYSAFALSPYGSFWRDMRKLAMTDLLSSHRLKLMKHVQCSEVSYLMQELSRHYIENDNRPVKVDLSEMFESMVMNMVTRMVAGKRSGDQNIIEGVPGGRHMGEIMKDVMDVTGSSVPSDFFPFLKWTDYLGMTRACKKVVKELDEVMESWVKEHESNRNSDENSKDFIDVLLSKVEDDSQFGNSRRTVIKATIMSLIFAGSDTTSVTMVWLVACLLNNKRVLNLAQEEIDQKVGRERTVEESDIEKLVYLNAVIKETLRLYPAGPLAVPRETMEDCTLYGYHIPKGTRMLTNIWKLHHDPDIWEDPEEFKPERFLTSHANVEYTGQHFVYLPFGSGRRSCPGSNFAVQVIQLTIARLLQGFNLSAPNDEAVDMTESLTLTLYKEAPLEVMITPRLPPKLYE